MATSGGTTGTLVVGLPAQTGAYPNLLQPLYTIEAYWNYLQINENAGYGIRNYPNERQMGCDDLWQHTQRFFLAEAIWKSLSRLEADRWLGFPLLRKYYDNVQRSYTQKIALGKWLRGVGVETNTLIHGGKTISLSNAGIINDPVQFTVIVTFTDIDELVITYPGTMYRVTPSHVSIVDGMATVKIPRARLLKTEFHRDYDDVNQRPQYDDDDNFLSSVDVYRNYLDVTTGANLVWWGPGCNLSSLQSGQTISAGGSISQLAAPYVTEQRFGILYLEPATYSDNAWHRAGAALRRCPNGVQLNYMRGYYDRYDFVDPSIARAIIAITHNNLPHKYCAACEVQGKFFEDDNRPLEPAARLGMGRSTWGLYYAEQLIREFDAKQNPYRGGAL